MRNILTLVRREIGSYFVSPIAYVAMAIFLLLSGGWLVLVGPFTRGAPADMRALFSFGVVTIVVLPVVAALLTMRSLSEEHRSGTIETLMTAPVTDVQVVLGKFLGCWFVFLVMLLPTLVYVGFLEALADPVYGPIAAGYLGLALQGALYVAVGLFASSLTRNQVISAVVAFSILLGLILVWPIARQLPSPWRGILQQASIPAHYQGFSEGLVGLVHVIYFVVVTAFVLFVTVKILESRRWR